MASYSWALASNGNWTGPNQWSPSGGPPTSADSATIAATGSKYSVSVNSSDAAASLTISSANATVNDDGALASLTIGGTLTISAGAVNVATMSVASGALTVGALNLSGGALTVNTGGTLNLGGTLSQTGGTLTLNGGTIAGGTIKSTAGTLNINNGTLSGTTFDGPLNLNSTTESQSVDLANGATVVGSSGSGPGTINVTGYYSQLNFDNTQTVSNLTINLGNASSVEWLEDNDTAGAGNQVLTLASSVTVDVTGYAYIEDSGYSGDGIVNQGVIDQTGGNLYVYGNAFTNSGTIDAKSNGGGLTIDPTTFTNSGTIDVANGDSADIGPTTFKTTASSLITIEANSSVVIAPLNTWSNVGSITLASGASLFLGGSISAASLGSITNSGGTVYIEGTYNNSGQTLNGSASFGQLVLLGGAITGGTATTAGVAFTGSGTLSGVTFDGPLKLTSSGQSVHLGNGTTVLGSSGSGPGTINVTGVSDALYFDNTQTFSNVTINLGNSSYTDDLYDYDAGAGGQVLTLASSVAINATGSAQISDGGNSGDKIVNQGVIDQTGGNLNIQGKAFTNSGNIDDSGGALNIEATTFTNSGVIQLGGGTLTSSGASVSLTDAAGSKLSGYGTVTATNFANSGTIEASGGTLTLTNAVTGTGGLQIDGGADLVIGGAIASGATATFNGANATLTLNQPSTFGATIGGIGGGDVFDLVGITANGATVNGSNQLVVTENGTTVETLQLSGSNSGFSFSTMAVSGGTDIVVQQQQTTTPTVAQYLANPSYYDGLSGGFTILDTAAHITTALDQLSDPKINSITISDNGAIGVSVAQLSSDATAIGKLANQNGKAYQLAVTDTAADITAGLDGLNGSNIASITISNNAAVGASVAQLSSDATAIGKLANQNGKAYQLAVTDTAVDITAGLNGLNGSNIASITISNNAAVGASIAQLSSDATAIGKLANQNGNPFQLAISDTAANVTAALSTLEADVAHIASITASNGPVTVSAAIDLTDQAALDKIVGGFAISDTLPDIVSNLSAFDADANITSIAATSGSATLEGGVAIAAPAFSLTGSGTALTLKENLAYSGALTVGAGATVLVSSDETLTLTGTNTLSGSATGSGTLAIAGGTTTLNGAAALTVSHWTVSGAGTNLVVGENLTYKGKFSAGSGATLTLSGGNLTLRAANSFAGAVLGGAGALTDSAPAAVSGLTIGGTTTFDNTKTLTENGGAVTVGDASGNAATLVNASTGIYDITDDSGIGLGLSTLSSISNSGLFEKTGGTGTSAIAPSFANAHDLLVSSGTLDLQGAVSGTGTDTISGASTLQFDSTIVSTQTIDFSGSGGGTLDLTDPLGYSGSHIGGFVATDAVDLGGAWSISSFNENGAGKLGTLTLTNGTNNVALVFAGDFTQSSFQTVAVSGGTDIVVQPQNSTATVAQYLANPSYYDGLPGGFAILDTAANITTGLNQLKDPKINSITISDNGAIGVSVAQLTSDATAIGKLANANTSPYQLTVADTAANVQAGLSTLEADVAHIASITASNGPVTVSAAIDLADQTALDKIVGGFAISDTLPDIVSNLSAFDADANIASIAATSGSATLEGGVAIAAPAFSLTGSGTALTLKENLAYSGALTVGAGATVLVSSDETLTLSGTNRLSGAANGLGTLAIAGGTTTLNGAAALTVSHWTVSGAGTNLVVGENLTYKGKFSAGSGATLTLSGGNLTLRAANSFAGAVLGGAGALTDSAPAAVSGLTIGGTTTFDNTKTLTESGGAVTVGDASGNAATLANASTGIYDITDNSGIGLGSSSLSSISNSGTFEKTGGTGTSAIAPSFANAHHLIVSSGTLDLQGAVSGTGTDTISGASTLQFDSTIASTQTIDFSSSGGGTLDLTDPLGYSGSHIGGFVATDAVDLAGSWSLLSFKENGAHKLGTLTLTNGANNLPLVFAGDFTQSSFTISPSGPNTIIGHA